MTDFHGEKPDRLISYHAIKELVIYFLGMQVSKKDKKNLVEKYKGKHAQYRSRRRLIQRSIDD